MCQIQDKPEPVIFACIILPASAMSKFCVCDECSPWFRSNINLYKFATEHHIYLYYHISRSKMEIMPNEYSIRNVDSYLHPSQVGRGQEWSKTMLGGIS
jgi:hypothetical protein